MIPRPPLTYTTPAQIVRLWHCGFRVPMPVYLFALSQMPPKPAVEYRTADVDDEDAFREAQAWREHQNEVYDMRHKR